MPSKPGQRKRRPLQWDDTLKQVLHALFEGRQSHEKIAADCSVSVRTLRDWIAHPDFQAKLAEKRQQMIDSLTEMGVPYVRKEQRIMGLAQMGESARQEYEARPWLKETKMISHNPQTDEDIIQVNESFNRDAHAAFRESLAEIAAELGDRKNVTAMSLDVTGNVSFYLPQPETPPDETDDSTGSH